jgi:hypothetical protein
VNQQLKWEEQEKAQAGGIAAMPPLIRMRDRNRMAGTQAVFVGSANLQAADNHYIGPLLAFARS